DFVLPFRILSASYPGVMKWENSGPDTYVLLKKGTNVDQFNKKIAHLISTKIQNAHNRTLFIRRYSDAYLYGNYDNGVQSGGRIEYVRLFSIIVIFIVFIACINFMNLSTAKASGRMKEIGVKKLLGARKGSLVLQYIGESVLMVFLAMIVAIILVALFLPQFNDITGKHISLALSGGLLISLVGATLVTGLIAGSYPAFYLSRFMPVGVIKGKFVGLSGEVWVRKGLVIFQFAISVILIISVLAVSKQIEFVQTRNPGFTKQHIISFDAEGKVAEKKETFLSEIRNIRGVVAASSIGEPGIIGDGNTVNDLQWKGKAPDMKIPFARRPVDFGLLKMLDIKMESGRDFSRQFGSDSTKIIFNEAAIKAMGLKDPIGKTIQLEGHNRQIIGVVRNFHFESLYNKVNPLFFILKPDETQKIMVKLEPGTEQATINRLHNFYQKFNTGFTFDYSFLNQQYQAQYNAVQRVSVLSLYFAMIAILISCLGLFGLVAFTAERRQKEIGIRKVLGSSVIGIVSLLSKDFLKLVGIGFLIAIPIAWYAMHSWLQNFAYHIDIGIGTFVLAGVVAMTIALATVSWQSIRAALMNPVESLRNE
ncbi:MAG TPA: FtsX-like permease family protein, partial [Balneolales bacterium]|nr:FtsX-like permease family protein [Balneolales bacterium]